jgi:TadE-like protein
VSRGRRERGQASIELVALLPVLVLGGSFALQAGAAMWAASSTTEATREAARAFSLGRDPRAAAEASLPGGLHVSDLSTFGPGHGVRLTVVIPRVAPMPHLRVTRQVVMP